MRARSAASGSHVPKSTCERETVLVPSNDGAFRLDLHGEKAASGIELASLENFIDRFRAVLRDFERAASNRSHQIGAGGHPEARTIAATTFVLRRLEPGSAVLTLDEPTEAPPDGALDLSNLGPATANLWALLQALENHDVPTAVVDSLEQARRSLGESGWFGITAGDTAAVQYIDSAKIAALYRDPDLPPEEQTVTVFGRLHLIEVEGQPRVEVRASDGYNWVCSYDPRQEAEILGLVKERVRVRGFGTRERPNRGSMKITAIEPMRIFEQSELFSIETIPHEVLEANQGIAEPQGLTTLANVDLENDAATERFLAIVLEDIDS